MKYNKIHIFTPYGATYTFFDVYNFRANETVITFTYTAQSDLGEKHATFYIRQICGYTTLSTYACNQAPCEQTLPKDFSLHGLNQ